MIYAYSCGHRIGGKQPGQYGYQPNEAVVAQSGICKACWETEHPPVVTAATQAAQRHVDALCNEGGDGYGSPRNQSGPQDNTPRYKGDDHE